LVAGDEYAATLAFVAALIWSGAASAETRHTASLLPPVSPACISSPFGPRVLPDQPQAGSYHYGIDLPAPEGTPVLAAAPGTVIRVQNKGPGGLEMLVQHAGFVGVYSHLAVVMPEFAKGNLTVAAGQQLGMVGNTGITSGAHLYFEMIRGGRPIDPAPYLAVSQCNGEVHRTVTVTATLDASQQHASSRQYYQIFPTGEVYVHQGPAR
jgi:murein DD-endopeptidase MepM/ murein hydrolase activator NlpD